MTVRIQLDDGTIREYPVVNPLIWGSAVTRCGAGDCEHPACALELAGKMKGTAKTTVIGFSFLELSTISLAVLMAYPFDDGFASVSRFQLSIILLTSLLLIFGIWHSWRLLTRFGPATEELEEYIQSCTVKGRPARQVLSATAPPE
jgi:hypothetical protein